MQPSDPFPLTHLTPRIRSVVLDEFQGRHPTILEVIQIPEAEWLKRPSIGPGALAQLRSVAQEVRHQVPESCQSHMSNAELLAERGHLVMQQELLQAKLRQVHEALRVNKAELWIRGLLPQLLFGIMCM